MTIADAWSSRDYSRMDSLGTILLAAREAKGWRQRDVAERLEGAPESAVVNKYEKGRQLPSTDRMAELIALLDLDEAVAWRAYLNARVKPALLDALAARESAWSPGE